MGISEIVLIILSVVLLGGFITILFVAYKRKKADEKKAKDDGKKAVATTPAVKPGQQSRDGVARTINLNRIIGKNKEEIDKYFNQVMSAKTSTEVEKINLDVSLIGVVKIEEVGEIDDFATFGNDESFFIEEENEVARDSIKIGQKNPAYDINNEKNGKKSSGLRKEFNNASTEMKSLVISGLDVKKFE